MRIFGFKKKDVGKKEKGSEKSTEEVLKEKYGVLKEIPERKLEVEGLPFQHVMRPKEVGEPKLPDLLLRIEKMDGKLDFINSFRDNVNERITQLAEEIGELRTMVMERDRSFDKISVEFETVRDTVTGLEPMKLKKHFEKREKEIVENKAKIESIENLVKALGEESKKFRSVMEKIKSFENLIDVSYDIDRRISKIKGAKDHVDMVVSKVENIFSEMNDKVSELESQREKIDKLDGLTIEMTKMLDEVSVRLNRFVEKKDLNELKKDVDEDLKKIEAHLKGRVPVKGKPVPVSRPFPDTRLTELYSQISKLKSIIDSQNMAIKNIISRSGGRGIRTGGLEIRNIKLSLRFFQVMNILAFGRNAKKIREYLSEVREIAQEMKSNGIWNEEKESYMREILNKLSRRIEPLGNRKSGTG